MNELTALQSQTWQKVDRRRRARDELRSRRAALDGRLELYADLLAAATDGDQGDRLVPWRAELHTRTADELQQRGGVTVAHQFLTAAHEKALRDLEAGL